MSVLWLICVFIKCQKSTNAVEKAQSVSEEQHNFY